MIEEQYVGVESRARCVSRVTRRGSAMAIRWRSSMTRARRRSTVKHVVMILKVVQQEIEAHCSVVEMAWCVEVVVMQRFRSTTTMMKSTTRDGTDPVAAQAEERRRSRRRTKQNQNQDDGVQLYKRVAGIAVAPAREPLELAADHLKRQEDKAQRSRTLKHRDRYRKRTGENEDSRVTEAQNYSSS